MAQQIPEAIDPGELLIRGIVYPMFYSISSNAVKREAFLAPPNRADVSLLRHTYAESDTFCRNHCKNVRIGSSEYCGMATFLNSHIEQITEDPDINIKIVVEASPLNVLNQIIPFPVFTDTAGLPMHADIIFDTPTIKGEPNTKHRKFANKLAGILNFFRKSI